MSTPLDQASVTTLKGVGAALAGKLAKIGILTLQDLLFHLPLRYEDRTRITPIGALKPGQGAVVEGTVVTSDIAFGRRRSLLAMLQDQTGTLAIRFFHFSKAQQENLKKKPHLRCFGEVRRGAAGLEMYHPEYATSGLPLADTLTPVYPTTEGITQPRMRTLVNQVLGLMDAGQLLRNLGEQYAQLSNPEINLALKQVHQPPTDTNLAQLAAGTHPAQQRLAFEELLAHHASMRLLRRQARSLKAPAFKPPGNLSRAFIELLAFDLTGAQKRVYRDIAADLGIGVPMLRLVQGDVGSGKTVVAALAALQAVENGYQAAIMAPTEILAEQHVTSLSEWFLPLGVEMAWLTGKLKGRKREVQTEAIATGTAGIIVGTHALFQQDVSFNKLGLVIIDEQHRFGVHQRLALREKGARDGKLPHQLVMTATPIPRTLTMSLYADMDSSIIDELPPGRKPITTTVLPDLRRPDVVSRINANCQAGAQAYWVCTLIEESEVLQCQAAEVTANQLIEALPNLAISLIHGRMAGQEKVAVMRDFKAGKIDLLVATTVIEVGVDVPNASLMVIENPERLGLAQLHQLRGRIGRGSRESFCVLLYQAPLSETPKRRLNVMRETQDGFIIAEEDLKIRGPGELFGSRQSGDVHFRIADLLRDSHLLDEVRQLADTLLDEDPATADKLLARWMVQPERLGQV